MTGSVRRSLQVETLRFDEPERERWKRDWSNGQYAPLARSGASSSLKRVLTSRAVKRPYRFFGEGLTAMNLPHEEGWYGSFKWLPKRKWVRDRRLPGEAEEEFRLALRHHFPRLAELQNTALVIADITGQKPVTPDLWLMRDRKHWFLEVKIPPDKPDTAQLAGLPVIACRLPSRLPVRVGVVYVVPRLGVPQPRINDDRALFDHYCSLIKTV